MKTVLRAWSMAAVLAMTVGAGAADAPPLAALDRLPIGEWELRAMGKEEETRRICVRNPRQFLQIQHAGNQCRQFVVNDTAQSVSITYECAAAGGGRTDLRIETARLIQIRSQGVANGAPFSLAMEGRRLGACP